ncbi:hypothetical protein [Acinetobacter bereziniae]|uniref:hypothetical protein n=1 Tax=Acinetobacter bereziniae TaxID=106648 RepID=UPI00073F412D|nr:hypothetical protein [Acinetobacter bereziniae]RSZ27172.1 hypothetical protein NDM229_014840 [Acinetobacter bereziniae]
MVDIYRGQTKQNAKVEQIKIKLPVRLIIYGGARSASDNSAFLHASKNVIKDYRNDLPIKSYFMSQGIKQLINAVNQETENSVQSLDIFSHGSELGLYTVIGASLKNFITHEYAQVNNLASNLYRNRLTKINQYEIFGGANWRNSFVISEINFKVFTIESKIEIHGCHSAFDGESDTLCALMSKALYQVGKKRSVVIGHADFATPNRGGTKIISQQDYRHEERVIYNNGNVIARIRAEGRISSSFIKRALGG